MLHVALLRPRIPQNTGNIGRLTLSMGARLHLVGELGFDTDEKACRRAGLDYWKHVDCLRHDDLEGLRRALPEGGRLIVFSTRAARAYSDVDYREGDCLLFGDEVEGLPQEVVDQAGELAVRIPLRSEHSRSLNLANAVAIGVSEAYRQLGHPHPVPPRPRQAAMESSCRPT
jgi:tRNA (cytidine/uridine-2'-O-)-methyltransferase